MQLILDRSPRHYHVSQDNSLDFETEILADPRLRPLGPAATRLSRAVYYSLRLLEKGGLGSSLRMGPPVRIKRDLFCILIGLDLRKAMPLAFSSGRKCIYMFDAWPSLDGQFEEWIRNWGIEYVFLPARSSVERLAKKVRACRFLWVPEGARPETYHFRPYEQKDIEVLQFGRKFDRYHERIAGPLGKAGRVHLFERKKGEIVFPTKEGFLDGLARARVSICFPSSLTHPEWSGGVETLTSRYLQSILSKCLIVGQAPRELIDLFGYNPVVEVDWRDPAGQLLDLLDHFPEYIPLIERNYLEARSNHTWKKRWQQIAGLLFP